MKQVNCSSVIKKEALKFIANYKIQNETIIDNLKILEIYFIDYEFNNKIKDKLRLYILNNPDLITIEIELRFEHKRITNKNYCDSCDINITTDLLTHQKTIEHLSCKIHQLELDKNTDKLEIKSLKIENNNLETKNKSFENENKYELNNLKQKIIELKKSLKNIHIHNDSSSTEYCKLLNLYNESQQNYNILLNEYTNFGNYYEEMRYNFNCMTTTTYT